MMKAKHEITLEKLEKDGWTIDHSALCSYYRYAGSISEMASRRGREYCRLHVGKCVGRYQKTLVLSRAINQKGE